MALSNGEPVLLPHELLMIQAKHPDRVPVFVLRGRGVDPSIPGLPKIKFVVPKDLTFGQFSYVVRHQMSLPAEKALFLFCGNTLLLGSSYIKEIYAQHKSSDGALRVIYMSESTFG
jgi:GABA(A) receptor-associated protein